MDEERIEIDPTLLARKIYFDPPIHAILVRDYEFSLIQDDVIQFAPGIAESPGKPGEFVNALQLIVNPSLTGAS